jgi:hypothetical protein
MIRYFRVVSVAAAFLLSMCLPALADGNFSKEKLTGNSGSTVSGSFTFNSSTDTFSNLSLLFNGGKFKGTNATDASGGQATCVLGVCGFSWQTHVNGVLVWDTILLNVKTGVYQDFGGIQNFQNQWNFDPPATVPEGGTPLPYLVLSGLAMVAGILISGKRRAMRSAQHS